jgi:GTPase
MLDSVVIHVAGGTGGAGASSFHREKFIPLGGPDGGDGGRGGQVFVEAIDDIYTLEQYRSKKKFAGGKGVEGGPKLMTGHRGESLVLQVPVGTLVFDDETGDLLADFKVVGERVLIAHGGKGGWGNKRFATSTNQAPRYAQKGYRGEELEVRFELQLLADVGLIGLPNAGKSTLLAAVSNAKPKIAAYPFTTLEPMLGVVNVKYSRFTLADLPGLIEGASEGYGLGFEFLKHVRRCRVLLHVVDSSSEDPVTDFELIEQELRTYDTKLDEVPRVIAVTKSDLDEELAQLSAGTLKEHLGKDVQVVSAVDGVGTKDLLELLHQMVTEEKARAVETPPDELPVLRPRTQERFTVEEGEEGEFVVDGRRIVAFVEMMDMEMEGARDEVERRLHRWGVSKVLRRKGVKEGDTVHFGEVSLNWRD